MTEVSFTMYWLCLLWRDTDIIRLLSLAGRLNSLGTTLGGTRWWSEQRAASVGRAFLQKHDWERTNTEMWWCLISTDDASVWNARRVIRWHDRGLFVVFVACNDHRAAACLSVCRLWFMWKKKAKQRWEEDTRRRCGVRPSLWEVKS